MIRSTAQNIVKTGVADIDAQHEVLIACLNDLCDGVADKASCDAVSSILDKFVHLGDAHYRFEESCMEAISYYEAEAHRKVHRDQLNFVRKLADDLRSTGILPRQQVVATLRTWFQEHVRTMDVDLMAEWRRQWRRHAPSAGAAFRQSRSGGGDPQ